MTDYERILRLIKKHLQRSDRKQIALDEGVSFAAISEVLNNRMRSERLFKRCYDKAIENKGRQAKLIAYLKKA